MDTGARMAIVAEETCQVSAVKLKELAEALGREHSLDTAGLALYFGPTIAGESRLVDTLKLDLSKAFLVGQSYQWERPLIADETVTIKVFIEDVYLKGENSFGVVTTEIKDSFGTLVQTQKSTFIEKAGK